MMLAEFPLVVTKDYLLILAHQGAVEYLLLLLLLLDIPIDRVPTSDQFVV